MNRAELIRKITEKKDFSQLPEKDVEMALEKFDKPRYIDEEKIKLTRDLLRKVFSVFTSSKLLNVKDKDSKWVLNKHLSTKERIDYYSEVYSRIFENINSKEEITVFDLGAGVNGFSYEYFPKPVNYIGIEAMNQLVDLTNNYFKINCLKGHSVQESLFDLERIKSHIKNAKGKKIIFLFKVIDSLEMLKEDYSKELLLELTPLVDKMVISFATRSLLKKQKFKVNRKWIIDFVKENFEFIGDFEFGNERYIEFKYKPKFK